MTAPKLAGVKHDSGKVPLDLLPFDALESIAAVLAHGADKYGARNWEQGMDWSRVFSAALRHLFAWGRGEKHDPEWGLPHLAHAACCVLFLLSYELRSTGHNDVHAAPEPFESEEYTDDHADDAQSATAGSVECEGCEKCQVELIGPLNLIPELP